MSLLIIEDGTRVVGANSYISAADATAYLTLYEPASIDSWPTAQADQEAALLVGNQSLELFYRERFLSFIVLPRINQLSWPRTSFFDRVYNVVTYTTIPDAVKQAQATLALYYVMGTDVFPQLPRDSHVINESVKIGDLSTSTVYSQGTHFDPFLKITKLLWPVLKPSPQSTLFR